MFTNKSNALCNNDLFSSPRMATMHIQMERLYAAAKQLRSITGQTNLAKALNASPQTVKNWESRGISDQGKVTVQRIIGCSSVWLATGEGNMHVDSGPNVINAEMGTRRIPLVSYVQAGDWTETVDSYHPGDAASWMFTDRDLSSSAFALEIKGDSMLPEFNPGDRVIIDPAVRPKPGDFVVAKNGDHEATFKKYRPRGVNEHGEQVIELVPLNQDFPSIRSDTSPLTIIGTMVEHRRYRKK